MTTSEIVPVFSYPLSEPAGDCAEASWMVDDSTSGTFTPFLQGSRGSAGKIVPLEHNILFEKKYEVWRVSTISWAILLRG